MNSDIQVGPAHAIEILSQNPDRLYSTEEVAAIFDKSKAWAECHRWAGTGPRYLKLGRTPYYKGSDLLAYIGERTT